jgi:hypothetical protein
VPTSSQYSLTLAPAVQLKATLDPGKTLPGEGDMRTGTLPGTGVLVGVALVGVLVAVEVRVGVAVTPPDPVV